MKTHSIPARIVGYSMILCLQAVEGVEIPKLFNNIALNLPGAWSGDVVPGPADVALWNELFVSTVTTVGALSPLGADLSLGGIKVTAVGGTRNLNGNYVGFHSASSAQTLTLGAAGFDLSAATQAFFGSSKITLSADQPWNISNANTNTNAAGNNNGEDLAFQAQFTGTPFNFNGKTVTTSGAGQVTITSGYALSNGTLNVGNNLFVIQGGSNRATSLTSDLNLIVSSGLLRLQSNSGAGGLSISSAASVTVNGGTMEFRTNNPTFPIPQSGPITVNAGGTLSILAAASGLTTLSGAITVNGAATFLNSGAGFPVNGSQITGNLSGIGPITYQNIATTTNNQFNFSGNNSGFTGTFDINGASGNRSVRLSNANAGSAAATWNVASANTLQVDGVSVQLGTLTGAGTVTNSSTTAMATLNIGAGIFSGIISDGTTQVTGLNKIGPGNLVLSGPNTYSGLTTVSAGKLSVSTSQIATTPANFTVADGATLAANEYLPDTTLAANTITLGSAGGSTFEIGLGTQANPVFAPVSATNLLVNGPTTLRLSGTKLTTGSFPLIQYVTLGGTSGFGGLTLKLPARTTGTLTNTAGTIGVNITQAQQIKWVGNISDNWDIDPDGTQTAGTPNWVTTVTGVATRYLQGSGGTDVVNFDDSASGSGTVNLTTVLSPIGITVNNSAKAYTFIGTGKIIGSTGITKSGTGALTIANTAVNDYTGTTAITQGTLRLGDGVTVGGGIISGSIVNDGRLVLNRPSDHVFSNPISGTGTLEKAANNTVTIGAFTFLNPLVLTAGKLLFNAGATLSGPISGTGALEGGGGNLLLDGFDANTFTGPVTVTNGSLRLNKAPGTQAVGGDITLTGGATLAVLADEQIADTATINAFGTSQDSMIGTTGKETFANANVNGPSPATQLILRNFAVVTGTVTVTQGIFGVGSGQTGTANSVVLTSPNALVRIAGNASPSTLNVGAGGITASAGEIQVKFNTADQDATLNLAGGLTTTGNLAITNAGYTGLALNVINLLDGAHTFNIGAATTTTVAPDFGGTGSLVKTGTGTLVFTAASIAAYAGGTTVSAGSLIVDGSVAGPNTVAAAGTIGGSGSLAGGTTVQGTIAPGDTVGKLTTTGGINLAAGSAFAFDVANWAGTTPGTDWDLLSANALTLSATPASKLTIRVAGAPTGFTETAKTLVIATSVNPITGFNAAAVAIDTTGFSGTGTFSVQQTGNSIELVYAAGAGGTPYQTYASAKGLDGSNNAPTFDADKDGSVNFVEFALDGNPLSGAASGKSVVKVATVGAEQALTLTIPVRSNAAFSGATEQVLAVDGLVYRVQGSDQLTQWDLVVSEVTGADANAIQAGLPALGTGYFYRTFRSPGPVVGDPMDFLRVKIEFTN